MIPTDAIPAAEFLIRHLYRSIDLAAGKRFSAVAENENRQGDNWFWNDDNAKSLEFLSRPEVWQRFPAETAEVLHFVRSMCRGPYIFRRISGPRLEPTGTDGALSGYLHSLMQLQFDLSRGDVAAGVRFHDERTRNNLHLTGNRVEFTHRRRRFRLNVDSAISNTDIAQEGNALRIVLPDPSVPHWESPRACRQRRSVRSRCGRSWSITRASVSDIAYQRWRIGSNLFSAMRLAAFWPR